MIISQEAKISTVIASLIANIGANTAGFEQGAKKVKGGLTSLGSTINQVLPPGVAQFTSLAGAITFVGITLQDTIKAQIEYANSVRELATVGQTSTEAASRFIQVLDDYKISAAEATLASKALKEKGMVPTIETLAKLSDAYLAIKDPAEKMKFVQDNLGRGGTKWVEVLNKGSAALLKQNDAVAKNLILTQKMVDDARKAEIATDSWTDAVTGLKTSFAVELLPALTSVVNHFNDVATSLQEQGYWYTLLHQFNLKDVRDRREQATALMLATGAVDENSDSLDGNTSALFDNQEAIDAAGLALDNYIDHLDAVSQANLDMESMSRTIAEDQRQYADDHAGALDKVKEAQFELNVALGKFGGGKKKLDDFEWEKLYDNLGNAQKNVQDLEATWHESANNMIYDMVLVGLSAGGLLDSEQKALDEYAVKAGIKTQADIDEANRRREIADSTIAGILQSEDVLAEQRKVDAETLRLTEAQTSAEQIAAAGNEANAMGQVSAATQKEIELQMILAAKARNTAIQYASIKMVGPNVSPYKASSGSTGGKSPDERDSGGSGIAGTPYIIGTGAQPELFVPSTNGTFIPNADKKGLGGSVINVYITNPKREAAENSVQRAVRNIIYTGAAA